MDCISIRNQLWEYEELYKQLPNLSLHEAMAALQTPFDAESICLLLDVGTHLTVPPGSFLV